MAAAGQPFNSQLTNHSRKLCYCASFRSEYRKYRAFTLNSQTTPYILPLKIFIGQYHCITYLLSYPSWNYQRNLLDKSVAEALISSERQFPEKQVPWKVKAFAL